MGVDSPAEVAKFIIRNRIADPTFVFSFFSQLPGSNYSKLKYIISGSVSEACNNSVLLLGPRGCGKTAVRHISVYLDWMENLDANGLFSCANCALYFGKVLELVLDDLLKEHTDMISVVRLNGLHSDNNCALKVKSPLFLPCCDSVSVHIFLKQKFKDKGGRPKVWPMK